MNENLKCTKCNQNLTRAKLYVEYYCFTCGVGNICFEKEDLIKSCYYNLYLNLNKNCYHLYSHYKKYTQLSLYNSHYESIFKFDKHINITGTLPLKKQLQKIVEQLLSLAIFL
jgi:hypothetical protein